MTVEHRGLLRAGRVASPHGLDGSFRVADATPSLLILGARVEIGGRSARITRRAGTDARPIVRLEGIEDRDGAVAIRGQQILAARSSAPELEAEEWWAEDLEACRVVDGSREVGTVRRLVAMPSCELLEVARGPGAEDLLVPLVRDAVRRVDLDRREIDIDLAFLGEA